jgi:23S rRNA (cytosine1962-C5)-methyltransferase
VRGPASALSSLLARSFQHRKAIQGVTTAYRLCDGAGDDLPGLYIDRYGPAAVLNVYDDARLNDGAVTQTAEDILTLLGNDGVESVYVKRFAKDRSRLGGKAPPETLSPAPRAGRPQPEVLIVHEYGIQYEVRMFDGFSTGLFLEHREHRRALAGRGAANVLNLFAYTCGFSVPLAKAGAHVTNVDVSARYLRWGGRNHEINDTPSGSRASRVQYLRMDAMAWLRHAARHPDKRFDLIILDPPTFGAADRKKGIKSWQASRDYPALIDAAVRVLTPGGAIFAATNSRTLALPGALRKMIQSAVPRVRWEALPPWPPDLRERGRVAAALFTLR